MPAAPLPSSDTAAGSPLVGRLRALHERMVEAVLGGEGLDRVAALAAGACEAPVAIVIPRLGAYAAAPGPGRAPGVDAGALRRYAAERVRDRPAPVPDAVLAEEPMGAGDDSIGVVLLLTGDREPAADAAEFLHLAAVASLTEVAIEEAKVEVEQNLRGSLLEDLRAPGSSLEGEDLQRRARRLGCELSDGAVALCAELTGDRPRHVVATIASEHPGALAQHIDNRVYALLPALTGGAEATLVVARRVAARLQRHGIVGLSSFCAEVGELSRAVQEAELVLDVVARSGAPMAAEMGTGTYRLLFRVLASHPEELMAFYQETVAALVAYDEQYRTDLVATLEAYLEHDCNMNATAAAIYAHRHTVAYRLERVRELAALDPMRSQDRERLGLGLKAYRIIAPHLHR